MSILAAITERSLKIKETVHENNVINRLSCWIQDFKDGFRYLKGERGLWNMYAYDAVANGALAELCDTERIWNRKSEGCSYTLFSSSTMWWTLSCCGYRILQCLLTEEYAASLESTAQRYACRKRSIWDFSCFGRLLEYRLAMKVMSILCMIACWLTVGRNKEDLQKIYLYEPESDNP